MRSAGPSVTAYSAARHRALHQLADGGAVFADPLAVAIAGLDDEQAAADAVAGEQRSRGMRWFIAARSRFADDVVDAALQRGVRQVVVLGAGLDTLAYRRSLPGVRIVEIDHPATQAWKRERLAAIGVPEPGHVTYVPVDLEREGLAGALAAGGVRAGEGAVVLWLGVLPYLTLDAVRATLGTLAGLAPVDVVLDYGEPAQTRDAAARAAFEERAARVAALGEPWITFLAPADAARLLNGCGLDVVEDVEAGEYVRRLLALPGTGRRSPAHLVHARATGPARPGPTGW